MLSFTTANKKITVFPSAEPNRPIIYLNTFGEEAEQVLQVLRDGAGSDFTLAAVSSLDWNRDMVPWDIPPISANSAPCIGGADHYLRLLSGDQGIHLFPPAGKMAGSYVFFPGRQGAQNPKQLYEMRAVKHRGDRLLLQRAGD